MRSGLRATALLIASTSVNVRTMAAAASASATAPAAPSASPGAAVADAVDAQYPGTAVQRLRSVHARVRSLARACRYWKDHSRHAAGDGYALRRLVETTLRRRAVLAARQAARRTWRAPSIPSRRKTLVTPTW